jgi:hypothetical protein
MFTTDGICLRIGEMFGFFNGIYLEKKDVYYTGKVRVDYWS